MWVSWYIVSLMMADLQVQSLLPTGVRSGIDGVPQGSVLGPAGFWGFKERLTNQC